MMDLEVRLSPAQQLAEIRLRLHNKAVQLGLMGHLAPEIQALGDVEADLAATAGTVPTTLPIPDVTEPGPVETAPQVDTSPAMPVNPDYAAMQQQARQLGLPDDLVPPPDHPAFAPETAAATPAPEPAAEASPTAPATEEAPAVPVERHSDLPERIVDADGTVEIVGA